MSAEEGALVLRRATSHLPAVLPQSGSSQNGVSEDSNIENSTEEEYRYQDVIIFPHSTHSFLFTERVRSIGFAYGILIYFISYMALSLALSFNFTPGPPGNWLNVPVKVSEEVQRAQYLAIFVALFMEEEIPTGLYLLRMITKSSLKMTFPEIKYWRFVLSALVRLILGYMFLVNAFLIVVKSEGVLEIFYDVLALQFLQQLDDIAFRLLKMDVLGKTLKRAATKKYFHTEFSKTPFRFRKKLTICLKAMYILNFVLLLGGVLVVSNRQDNGYYQCASVSVTFSDHVWKDALVTTEPLISEATLVYSYFNGKYRSTGELVAGRPVYREERKFDNNFFETKVGAEIKYCVEESAWVFTHENIRKSSSTEESNCPWLIKSEETLEYDLLDVSGFWSVWTGSIQREVRISMICDDCTNEEDCNYNGICSSSESSKGRCICNEEDGYFGTHCGHRLDKACEVIIGKNNDTWSATYIEEQGDSLLLTQYDRPMYRLVVNDTDANPTADEKLLLLVYSGSRWIGMNLNISHLEGHESNLQSVIKEFHGFWSDISDATFIISDATTSTNPVGVDFYEILEKGDQYGQYGPFGKLRPLQEHTGYGFFTCVNSDMFNMSSTLTWSFWNEGLGTS